MEEMYENLDDIQQSCSQLSSDYTTYKGGKFLSQSQQNLEFIYEVKVQNGNLSNMLRE